MTKKNPDEDDKNELMKFAQKKKAIAGIVILLAASFGALLTFTEDTSELTGYFLAEESEEVLVEELEGYEELDEETLSVWIEEKEEEYTEEEIRGALDEIGKDPDLVDEVAG